MKYEINEIPAVQEASEILPQTELIETGVLLERSMLEAVGEVVENTEPIIGNPEKNMESWHIQKGDYSCAVCCQEFVAEQLLGDDFSEDKMVRYASERGWFDPETGTTLSDVGNLLEAMGLEVNKAQGWSLSELAEELNRGHGVIAGVNNMVLEDARFAELPGYRANHAVQVIGLDYTNPNDVQVILNDSGVQNGQGRRVRAEVFQKAWATSGNFAVTAQKGAA